MSTLLRILEGLGLTLMLVPDQTAATVEKALTEDDESLHDPSSQWPDFLKELADED